MKCIVGSLFIVLFTAHALAQQPLPSRQESERFHRQLEQLRREQTSYVDNVPIDRRALFDYGAFLSANYFSIDDSNLKNHVLRQFDVVGYARLNLDPANEFYLRGSTGYRDFNEGDSFDLRGDEPIDPDLDRGYYRFNLRGYQSFYQHRDRTDDFDLTAKLGRDLAYWANGLALSQVVDGAAINIEYAKFNLELLAGITPTRTVDIDYSRPNFDHNTQRGFYGAMLSRAVGRQRPFIYALFQRDYNQDNVGFRNGITTVYDYNSYYLGTGIGGPLTDRLLYGVEVVYEGGTTLSNSFEKPQAAGGLAQIPQTEDQIQALAADFRLDYVLNDRRRTRFSAEAIIASGDPDRLLSSTNTFGGNAPHTNDRAFNGFGLLNTGLAFAPAVSNLIALRAGAVTLPLPDAKPFKRMQFGTDFFVFMKLDETAPIEEPTADKRFLGVEPDFFLNWQVTSDVTISLRYGLFFPGAAINNDDRPRHFFGAGVTYAF